MPPSTIVAALSLSAGASSPHPTVDVGPGQDHDSGDYALIAHLLIQLQHVLTRLRVAQASGAGEDSEWARHRVLFMIARSAPIRLSALADITQTDASTLSRQVAGLVRSGLIERRSDPDDGRASLLVLTADGRRIHDQQLRSRDEHYRRMLADWSPAECHEFGRLLGRFVGDLDTYRPSLADAAGAAVATTREDDESGELS